MSSSVRSRGSIKAFARELATLRVAVLVGVHGSAGMHSGRRQNLSKKTPGRSAARPSLVRRAIRKVVGKLKSFFRGKAPPKPKGPKREAKGSRAISLGELAAIHEYGIGVPMRSFLRSWAERSEHRALLARIAKALIDRRIKKDQARRLMGETLQASCQANIANGIPPANAPSTIERKGSSKPLIDTGQLRSSITWKAAR